MSKLLCIYHGNCADGFAAALAVRLHYGAENVDFHKGVYGDVQRPFVQDRRVIMVDFSYKRNTLLTMAEEAEHILILDHHKSAAEELVDLPSNVDAHFDMDRSGAMMAWEYFHNPDDVPALIHHIQDRDLWRFELDGTREIQAALFSYPYDFDVWETLLTAGTDGLFLAGVAIERKHHKDVAELLDVTQRRMVIGGYDVPVACLPYTMVSDAAHKMSQGEPFAACYWDTPNGRVFGLRSTEGGVDVSEVAVGYGGGGHAASAGFTAALGWEGDPPQEDIGDRPDSDHTHPKTIEKAARMAHEINAAYCRAMGDHSQPTWDAAPQWQRSSAINGVKFHLDNPDAGPEGSHENWLAEKVADGWKWGPEKDPELKTHPCVMSFIALPPELKAKDYLFSQVVYSLLQ